MNCLNLRKKNKLFINTIPYQRNNTYKAIDGALVILNNPMHQRSNKNARKKVPIESKKYKALPQYNPSLIKKNLATGFFSILSASTFGKFFSTLLIFTIVKILSAATKQIITKITIVQFIVWILKFPHF